MDNAQLDSYSQAVAAILRRNYETGLYTYDELVELTGISKATIVRVINGKREATAYYLHKLCEVYGITPGSVLDEADKAG